MFAGCQQEISVADSNNDNDLKITVEENTLDDTGASDASDDTRSFEEVLGQDIHNLSESQIQTLKEMYKEIENFEFTEDGSNEDAYYELLDAFDLEMMAYGLDVPFYSYTEVIDKYQTQINEKDQNLLYELSQDYDELLSDQELDYESAAYTKLVDKIESIFNRNGLPGEEISAQVENRSVHYAIYDVNKGRITFSEDSMEAKDKLTVDEKVLYQRLWAHIVKILPKEYMDLLVRYELNTDGIDNVMAHVIEESEDYSKWRLAIDIKDAINPDGSFSDEFTNTVIHEFAHVMTLHKGELQGDTIVDANAFETTEGYLKTDSYLNQFYQKFWSPIVDAHTAAVEEDTESASEEAVYAFYEKYADQFVSDYAATNPGEDIAETYRVFVMEEKPEGEHIRDQKILFMYEYPELVKIRTDIRKSLDLDR